MKQLEAEEVQRAASGDVNELDTPPKHHHRHARHHRGSRADDDHFPAHELYRDLLLLCTNVVVFFPRGTHEPKEEHMAVAAPAPAGSPRRGTANRGPAPAMPPPSKRAKTNSEPTLQQAGRCGRERRVYFL